MSKKWITLGRFKFRNDRNDGDTSFPKLQFIIQEKTPPDDINKVVKDLEYFEMFKRHEVAGGDYCFKKSDNLGTSFEHLTLIVKHRFALIDVFERMFKAGQEYEGALGKPTDLGEKKEE